MMLVLSVLKFCLRLLVDAFINFFFCLVPEEIWKREVISFPVMIEIVELCLNVLLDVVLWQEV